MLILLRTQVERTDKTPIPACHARVGSLCGFPDTAERVPAGSHKTGRCADVRECLAELQHRSRSACGRLSAEEKPQAAKQEKGLTLFLRQPVHFCPQCGQFRGVEMALFCGCQKWNGAVIS